MKVVLIYLPHPYLVRPTAQVPLGVMYLAEVLKRQGTDVEIRNYAAYADDEAIADLPQAELYGLTATSLEMPRANRFGSKIKTRYPEAKVVIGGPGATLSPDLTDWTTIDAICSGDGENLIVDIAADASTNQLKQVYRGKPVLDLDSLNFPARDMVSNLGGSVFAYNKTYYGDATTQILTSRGCPFSCAFCCAPNVTRHDNVGVRFRSPQSVYREIQHVITDFGVRQFRFADDMFTANRQRALDICKLLGPLNIAWRISARVRPFDVDLAKALKDAGCMEISFGVESWDNSVLAALRKGITAQDSAQALEICERIGLTSRMLLMIGTPGQTHRTIELNKEWIAKTPHSIIAMTIFHPLPGSDIWANPDRYGVNILNRNMDDYSLYMWTPAGTQPIRDIIKLKDRSLEEFHDEIREMYAFVQETNKINRG